MSLVKCPDCEKMVSDRVIVCPFCGCPKEFFSITEDTVTRPIHEENTMKNEEYIVFNFMEEKISYKKGTEKYANYFGEYAKKANDAYLQMKKIYESSNSIETAVSMMPLQAKKIVDSQLTELTKDLYKLGIMTTVAEIKQKYSDKYLLDYNAYLFTVNEKYQTILQDQSEREMRREQKSQNRMRWRGGGFGIGGALKGAMKAGVMNAAVDILHAPGDLMRESHDEKVISKELQKLYGSKNIKEEMCNGIQPCIWNIFKIACDELNSINYFEETVALDQNKAEVLYESTLTYEKNSRQLFENIIRCLTLYPGELKYYKAIEGMLQENETDIKLFIDFWNIGFLFAEDQSIILEEALMLDSKSGTLRLVQDKLVFMGDDQKDNLVIEISNIKTVDTLKNGFRVWEKGKMLMYVFYTLHYDVWYKAVDNACHGIYEKMTFGSSVKTQAMAEDEQDKIQEYIIRNFSTKTKVKAITYYREKTGAGLKEAKEIVDKLLG